MSSLSVPMNMAFAIQKREIMTLSGTLNSAIRITALVTLFLSHPVGATSADPRLKEYHAYVTTELNRTVDAVDRLSRRLDDGDTEAAKSQWIEARAGWERLGAVTSEYFPEASRKIDVWPSWDTGFHGVEVRLFSGPSGASAAQIGRVLRDDVMRLQRNLAQTCFDSPRLFNGLIHHVKEIALDKSSGLESVLSRTSQQDLEHNVQGVRALYDTVFREQLSRKDSKLAAEISAVIGRLTILTSSDAQPSPDAAEIIEELADELADLLSRAARPLGLQGPAQSPGGTRARPPG
jgi:iron uptake system component EfeO